MKLINNRYEIRELLGEGEFGVVYKIFDRYDEFEPIKTIKIYNSDKLGISELSSFKQEYFYMKTLGLPIIVNVYEFGKIRSIDGTDFNGDYYFFTMEMINGTPIKNAKISKNKKQIAEKIKTNLDYLHKNNYVHGDLSENNIFITDDENIIFIDLLGTGSKEDDITKIKNIIKNFFDIDYEKLDINRKYIKELIRNRFSLSLNHFSQKIVDETNSLLKKTFLEKKSVFLSFPNLSNIYYATISNYMTAISYLHNKTSLFINLSPNYFSFITSFVTELEKTINHEKIKKHTKKITALLERITVNTQDNTIFAPLLKIIEELSYELNIIFILKNFNFSDETSREFLKYIYKNYNGNKIIIFYNGYKKKIVSQKKDNSRFLFLESYISSDNFIYSKNYLGKLKNILLLNNKEFLILKEHKETDFANFLLYYTKILPNNPNSLEDFFKTSELIYEYYISEERFAKMIFYVYYMDKPVRFTFLKEIYGADFSNVLKILLENKILKMDGNNIDFYHNFFIFLRKKRLKNKDNKKIIKNILTFYTKKENMLTTNELLKYLFLLFSEKDYKTIERILKEKFLYNYNLNIFISRKELIKFFKTYYYKMEKKENKTLALILALVYLKIGKLSEIEEKNILEKYKNMEMERRLRFYYSLTLATTYLILSETENFKLFFKQAYKNMDKKNINDFINYENKLIRYIYIKERWELVVKKSKKIMKLLKNRNDYFAVNTKTALIMRIERALMQQKKDKKALSYIKYGLKLCEKYQIYNSRFILHTDLFLYYYNSGKYDTKFLHNFTKKGVEIAEQTGIYSYIIVSYNNYAIFLDYKEKIKYFKKGLNLSLKNKQYTHMFIFLYNLTGHLTSKQFYKLIKKVEKYIIDNKNIEYTILDNLILTFFAIFRNYIRIEKTEELKIFFENLKTKKIESKEMNKRKKLLLFLYEIGFEYQKNGKKNFRLLLEKFKNLLEKEKIEFSFSELFYINLLESFPIEFRTIILKNIKNNNYEQFQIFRSLFYSDKTDKEKLEIIEENLTFSYIPYFYFKILILYAYLLKKNGEETYKKFISFIWTESNAVYKKFKNKKLFIFSFYDEIVNDTKKYFPEEFKKYSSMPHKIKLTKNKTENFLKILERDLLLEGEIKEKFFVSILNYFGYDRIALFKKTATNVELLKKHILEPAFYKKDTPFYYTNYMDKLSTEIIKDTKNKNITSVLIIPIIDYKLYKRSLYTERSMSRNLMNKSFIKGFLYLDRRNTVSKKYNKLSLKTLSIFLSQYWQNLLNEEIYMRDSLTKLYLRDVFIRKTTEYIYEENGKNKKAALIMIDIDHFKSVNDTYGHQKGDEILRNVSKIISENLRTTDIVGRYGGEEIVVFLPNIEREIAIEIAERLRKKIEDAKLLGSLRELTISVGVSFYPEESRWISELIKIADERLYIAKENGRNQVISVT